MSIKNLDGKTALEVAQDGECKRRIQVALDKQKAVLELTLAAEKDDLNGVKILLERSHVDVNSLTDKGFTALMCAAENGQAEVVKFLLKAGAKIDEQNEYGDTALIWAAYKKQPTIVEILLDNGADICLKNKDKKTALEEADDKIRTLILTVLRKQKTVVIETKQVVVQKEKHTMK